MSVSTNELVCNPWSGSENYISCLYGIEIEEDINVELQINNISIHKDEIYLVIESGKVLKLENDSYSEFINIEDKVFYKDGGEEGLFDIAFYPNDDDFLISYTNLNNALQVDVYSNYRGQGYDSLLTLVDIFLRFVRVGAQAVFRNISGRHLESFFGVLGLILTSFLELFGGR